MTVPFDIVPAREIDVEEQKGFNHVEDVGGDVLPFDHLSGRRFEILAYRLTSASLAPIETATLVKTSGDRGRDVLLYRAGVLRQVVQCKNQQSPMTGPAVA